MKQIVVFVLAAFVFSLPAHAGLAGASALREYLNLLADYAEESPSLIHFSYSEPQMTDGLERGCASVDSERVIEFVGDLSLALNPEKGCDALCEKAVGELKQLLGERRYVECRETATAPHTYTERVRFQSVDRRYAIGFELGYSD
jgi:hypothetical protein